MIQKGTNLIPSDKSGVQIVKTFHLYKGFSRKISFFGDFVKVSVKEVKIGSVLLKKTKPKGLIIRTKNKICKNDGSFIKFYFNNVILLKKRTPNVRAFLLITALWRKQKMCMF